MKSYIILYNLEKCNNAQRVQIQNKLFGYNDHSNKGKYVYKREGIIQKYPHFRLSRGGFIIKKGDEEIIIAILKKNKAKIELIPIDIAKSFLKKS